MGNVLDTWTADLGKKEAGQGDAPLFAPYKQVFAASIQAGLDTMPVDQQAKVVEKLDPEAFALWAKNLPPDQKDKLAGLAKGCDDPQRKLILWSEGHKGQAYDAFMKANAELAAGATGERAQELQHIMQATISDIQEADREVVKLAAKWAHESVGGASATHASEVADVNSLEERKTEELNLETELGINITHEASSLFQAATQATGTWSLSELKALKGQLAHLTPDQREWFTEFKRDRSDSAGGEYFPDHSMHIYSENPNVWLHEMSHGMDARDDVGKTLSASQLYEAVAGYKNLDEDALRAELESKGVAHDKIDSTLKALKAGPDDPAKLPGFGNSGTGPGGKPFKGGVHEVEIDGVMYQSYDEATGPRFSRYNARALPRNGMAEKTTPGWRDNYDYAKWNDHNPEHMYEEHAQNALRDPVRVYRDFVDRPNQEVSRLDEEIHAMQECGLDTSQQEAEMAEVIKTRDTLRLQYDLVRASLELTPAAIKDMADKEIPETQRDEFKRQADLCSSPVQLGKLRDAYLSGTAVDQTMIDAQKQGLPVGQEEAFERDAKNCFTKEQVDKLKAAYVGKKRHDRTWNLADGDDDSLGY